MTLKANSIVLVAACLLATSSIGCSASRWMTRRDYAEMADPFLAAPQEKTLVAGSDGATRNPDGVARLGQPPAASYSGQSATGVASLSRNPGESSLNGPKPLQTAAVSDRNSMARATYPAGATMPEQRTAALSGNNGPSLSDFMSTAPDTRGGTQEKIISGPPISNAASTQFSNSEFAAFDAYVQQNQKLNSPSGSNVQTSFEQPQATEVKQTLPAATDAASARRSPLPTAFDPAAAPTAMQSNARIPAQAPPAWDLDSAATAFDSQTSAGSSEENPFAFAADQMSNRPSGSSLPATVESLSSMGIGFEAPPVVTTDTSRSELNSGTASTNPFAGFDQAPQNADNGKSSSLDNSFHIDSGWKPSQLVRP